MAEHKGEKKMHRRKRAYGGRADKKAEHMYNAEGSPEAKVAKDEKGDGFKRGGAMKERKRGGHVEGEKSMERMDKRARGGHVGHKRKFARGGSPLSAAHQLSAAASKGGDGHEGERVSEEP